jgi:hypothetical protein
MFLLDQAAFWRSKRAEILSADLVTEDNGSVLGEVQIRRNIVSKPVFKHIISLTELVMSRRCNLRDKS